MNNIKEIEKELDKYTFDNMPKRKMTANENSLGLTYTPLESVEDMLNRFPEEIWVRPELKFINPCVKCGVWLGAVAIKLTKSYLANGIFNSERDALTHVLNNQLYGYALNNKSLFNCNKVLFGELRHDGDNIVFKNVFEEQEEMKTKFDPSLSVVITNPPFNPPSNAENKHKSKAIFQEHVSFIKETLDPMFYAAIIPTRWIAVERLKDFRYKMLNEYGVNYIKTYKTSMEIFGKTTQIDGGVCYVLADKNNTSKEIEVETPDHKYSADFRNLGVIPVVNDNHNAVFGIINKAVTSDKFLIDIYKNAQNLKSNYKGFKNEEFTGSVAVQASYGKTYYVDKGSIIDNNCFDKHKVTFAVTNGDWMNSYGLFNIRVFPNNQATSQSLAFIYFDSALEAENCKLYLETKFVKALLKFRQFNKNYSSSIFSWVPLMDFTRVWTDEDLYEHFKLEPVEIEYLNEKVK